ncbi:MAG: ATP-binding protein [Phycisphaerales bacterium]|nr:ATP-binding protein [Phycisphaerales bacterium]
MKVKDISLSRFTVFEDVKVLFSPGLNVFIGKNATGKSHLMKLLYAILRTHEMAHKDGIDDKERIAARLKEKLAGVFKPDESKPSRLVRRRVGRSSARVAINSDQGGFEFKLTTQDSVTVETVTLKDAEPAVFIPSREAVAMYQGFIKAYEDRELSFDETYFDLCKALSGSPARGKRLKEANALVAPFEAILGGKVAIEGGRFQVNSADGIIEAHLLAEGYRKIAGLIQLINNGSLMQNGILFWDEPEANLNPTLVTKIAEALRTLASRGIQIFVATHDYLLTHELSLAVEYDTEPKASTRFHALTRNDGGPVTVESGDTLADLEHNAILDEFAMHYDREHDLFKGKKGPRKGGA